MASSSSSSSCSVVITDLLDLFDCPICMNFIYPPISQCPNGHHLCGDCKKKMNNRCPTCQKDIGDTRSLVLEKVGDTIMFPCKYREAGCSGSFKYDLKQEHEKECEHRPYECPFPCSPRCTFTGDVEKLVTHMTEDHHAIIRQSDKINEIFVLPNGPEYKPTALIYKCFSQHFILQWVPKRKESMVHIYLSFMGEQSEAENYRYKLDIGEEDRTGKITWQEIPKSIRKNDNYYGLALHGNMATRLSKNFLFRKPGIPFEVSIWRK